MSKKFYLNLRLCCIAIFSLVSFLAFSQKNEYQQKALDLIKKNAAVEGLSSDDIENMVVANAYFNTISQTLMVYVQQTYKGIGVYNGIQVFAFKDEKLVSKTGERIRKVANKVSTAEGLPVLSSSDALRAAALHINKQVSQTVVPIDVQNNGRKITFPSLDIAVDNITVELLWVPTDSGKVKLGWQVQIAPKGAADHWLIRVDALNGNIIGKDNFTVSCNFDGPHGHLNDCVEVKSYTAKSTAPQIQTLKSVNAVTSATYRVSGFPAESPQHPNGALALKTDPWLLASVGNAATTLKWHNDGTVDYSTTRGNNVYAQEDRDNNNNTFGNSATSTTASPSLTFDFPYNPIQPQNIISQNIAITNLFYWNNIMHDITYQYGFDEVSGNFQANNLGRGGIGNDYVIADAQDAGGTSNANFNTPSDGGKPRMQMYFFSSVPASAMYVNAPAGLSGYKYAPESNFVTGIPSATSIVYHRLARVGPITGDIVLYNDDNTGVNHLACAAPFNTAQLTGKIAMIDRGTCNFNDKVKNAQNAGAIAVIMVNNVTGTPTVMSGNYDATITIPAFMISLEDGAAIKGVLAANQPVNITLSPMDGDMDNGVMAHEYTHGISNRLTGGPANASCLQNAEQMGEGWSDYFALMITTDWSTATVNDGPNRRPIGTYVSGQAVTGNGIRLHPYSTNMSIDTWTYDMLSYATSGGEPHYVGEIWCSTIWDMTWNIIQQDNAINTNLYNATAAGGNTAALKLVMMGMKLQPCSPGFIDGRNAILKADTLLFNGKYSCSIWNAFARRGMGYNASQGSSASYTDQSTDYSLPMAASIAKSVNKATVAMNEELTYSFKVTAQCSPITSYKVIDTLPTNVTYVTGSGGTYDAINRTVTFSNINLASSQSVTYTCRAKVNTGTYTAPVQHINELVTGAALPSSWASTSTTTTQWVASVSQSYSSPYSFYCQELTTASLQTLTTTGSYNLTRVSTLSFYHSYNTESGYDGGVVEMSTDNGTNWFDIGPYMKVNGYNTSIAPDAATTLINRAAFSGTSNGFVQTVVDLSAFAGSTAKFRFRFASDNGGSVNGWYVDNINLRSESGVYNRAKLYDNLNSYLATADTVSILANVVPVQWGSFTAEKQGTASLLKWTTVQEQNSLRFIVERSIDGNGFSEIGSINASGNSNAAKAYTLTDALPVAGINYYRIKQIDLDGRAVYTDIKSVTFNPFKGNITVTPNPAKDKIAITVPGNSKTLQVTIVNAVGQKVQVANINGQYNQLQLNNLAPGLYYIKISGEEGEQTKKLLIQ